MESLSEKAAEVASMQRERDALGIKLAALQREAEETAALVAEGQVRGLTKQMCERS